MTPSFAAGNRIIQRDGDGIEPAAILHGIMNRYIVTRRCDPRKWPASNKCFRGTSMPKHIFEAFFEEGLIYRTGSILSYSFDEPVAEEFAALSALKSDGERIPIIFEENFDTQTPYPHCLHVNYLEHSLVKGEKEFLHSAYSIFEVLEILDREIASIEGRFVRLLAHRDNRVKGMRGLPVARWH